MLRTKSAPLRIKAAGEHEGTEEGVVEAIVAAYNLDSVGDKILPGAFEATLAEWKGRGDPIPFIWSHEWGDPDSHIGVVEDAKEIDEGLWVKARLDLAEPKAAKVYRLLKGRRVTQFSFGYEVEEGAFVDSKSDDGDGHPYYELRKLNLFECGPCLVGANQQTSLEAVKTAAPGVNEEHADQAALTADEVDAVRALLAKTTTTEELQDEKATPEAPAVDDEPTVAKSDEPAAEGTAALAAAQLQLMEAELSIIEETTV